MSAARLRPALDWAVPVLAGATVVAFAAGSSSIGEVRSAALDVRWLVLAALLSAALPWLPELRLLPPAVPVAAAALLALALVSALWSVEPRLTVERAVSVALLLAAATLIAGRAAASSEVGRRVLLGLLAGAAAVALLGAAMLLVAYDTAVLDASIESPARFRGFGESPNTVPLLLSLAAPLALAWALRPREDPRARAAAGAALVLFAATIAGSGSRGALLAAAAGAAVTLALALRGPRLAAGAAALVAAVAVVAALQSVPDEASSPPPPPAQAAGQEPAAYADAEAEYPLDNDVGRPLPGGGEPDVDRSFLGTSGRAEAWEGAAETAAERPLLGHGFGTEGEAFVDRYYGFVGDLPESSYLGIALQLGVAGLAALLGLLVVLALAGRRAARRQAACAGVVAAGLAAAVVQSYLLSAGNVATATFWVAAFLLAAPPDEAQSAA